MNKNEYEMLEVLKELKNEYGVYEIKAEFEAEGSRMEEMMRLKDVTTKLDLPIILKIGVFLLTPLVPVAVYQILIWWPNNGLGERKKDIDKNLRQG